MKSEDRGTEIRDTETQRQEIRDRRRFSSLISDLFALLGVQRSEIQRPGAVFVSDLSVSDLFALLRDQGIRDRETRDRRSETVFISDLFISDL